MLFRSMDYPAQQGGWQPGRPIKSPLGSPPHSLLFLLQHTSDLVAVETMALSVMCLGLALLGVLQSQAQDSTQNLIPAPSLLTVPLQPDFRSDQVGP